MNILITGDTSSIAAGLAKRLSQNKQKVVVAGADMPDLKLKDVIYHPVLPSDDLYSEIISAYRFDAVVFLSTREELLFNSTAQYSGKILDGLINTLNLCRDGNIKHLFFVSSTEVNGDSSRDIIDTCPDPVSVNGITLQSEEAQCKYYTDYFGLGTTIIRVPFVYGEYETNSFLHKIIGKCKTEKEIVLPAGENGLCAFLHVDDLISFILSQLDDLDYVDSGVVHLSPLESINYRLFSDYLSQYYPNITFQFDSSTALTTKPVKIESQNKKLSWLPIHQFEKELAEYMGQVQAQQKPKKQSVFAKLEHNYQFQELLKWFELVLGASITQFLIGFTQTPLQFKYIDFRLLFVVLFGIVHGTRFGLLASVLMCGSLFYSLYQDGMDWIVLVHSVEYWLPFALYIAAGVITGYLHDKHENQVRFQEENNQLLHEKYTFLYNVYSEIRLLKDSLHDQLMGYRDSFGRIYNIVHELDSLQEEEIVFKALDVLESVMSNNTIAIYSFAPGQEYLRLEVNSYGLTNKIAKSIKLSEYPEIVEKTKQREIFQNTNLLPDYPVYFAPILSDNVLVAAVVIWQANFDQQSLYYLNLFKVICGLIQSSIVRAILFESANAEHIFIPATRILQPDAFKKVLKTKHELKNNKNAVFQLVKVNLEHENGSFNWNHLYSLISQKIRTVDVIGVIDDCCYIVLSQADKTNVNGILERLIKSGVKCELVNDRTVSYA